MSTEVEVAPHDVPAPVEPARLQREQIELLKRTICKGASDLELAMFVNVCNRTGLDPFARQVFAVKRFNAASGRDEMAIQTSIDGYRLIAERSNRYAGQGKVKWCGRELGEDGEPVWVTLWTRDEPPFAAMATVHKVGFVEPMCCIARWDAYVQTFRKNGKDIVNRMWSKMGPEMLAKCAEALALRKSFPQEMSGVYTAEEMGRAFDGAEVPTADAHHVEAIRQRVLSVADETRRDEVIAGFRAHFGCNPARLPADQVGAAYAWVDGEGVPKLIDPHEEEPAEQPLAPIDPWAPAPADAQAEAPDPEPATVEAAETPPEVLEALVPPATALTEPVTMGRLVSDPEWRAAVVEHVAGIRQTAEVAELLSMRGLKVKGTLPKLRAQLVDVLLSEGFDPRFQ